jgi:hypothetical protein
MLLFQKWRKAMVEKVADMVVDTVVQVGIEIHGRLSISIAV